jgi:hypothetical protein
MNTFVKLPTGDVNIEHIREMVLEVKSQNFEYRKWFPRPGLREKKSNFVSHLYTGQSYDEQYFTLDHTGWTHDHCLICSSPLGPDPAKYMYTDGYFDGSEWICSDCFKELVLADNLEEKLRDYEQYRK